MRCKSSQANITFQNSKTISLSGYWSANVHRNEKLEPYISALIDCRRAGAGTDTGTGARACSWEDNSSRGRQRPIPRGRLTAALRSVILDLLRALHRHPIVLQRNRMLQILILVPIRQHPLQILHAVRRARPRPVVARDAAHQLPPILQERRQIRLLAREPRARAGEVQDAREVDGRLGVLPPVLDDSVVEQREAERGGDVVLRGETHRRLGVHRAADVELRLDEVGVRACLVFPDCRESLQAGGVVARVFVVAVWER